MTEEIDGVVDRAIQHIKLSGALDDIFRPPFMMTPREVEYLDDDVLGKRIRDHARVSIAKHKLDKVITPEKFNIPKSRYAYRHASSVDIADLVLYTSIAFLLAEDIEEHRIDRAKQCVFSYRYNKIGKLFSPNFTIARFRERSGQIKQQKQFTVKVEADIANYYDRLNIHRLQSVLAQIGCDAKLVNQLNDLLLYWAGRNSFGLPVGCDASRILAEAALINVDNGLVAENIKFLRFVDDFRIFASSYAEAHASLNCLIQLLDREGLFLNAAKTKILPILDEEDAGVADVDEIPKIEGFAQIDIAEKVVAFVVTGGQYSKISKVYREPGKDKIKEIQQVDINKLLNVIETHEVTETTLRDFIRTFIYKDHKDPKLIFRVIHRYIHMCGYAVDALIKEAARFSAGERSTLSKLFQDFYFKSKKADYYNLMIARLLCDENFYSPTFISKALANMPVSTNPVFFQQFVLMSAKSIKRPDLLALRDMCASQHLLVRRAIFHTFMEAKDILPAEKKAWGKTLAKSEADPFVKHLATIIGFNKAAE